ncbi:Lipase chaperone [Grimontia celer]|uniref:Lipase chaperone n=1 Tax=Grimontia celer TaxID=1796497 RepID=A0A128F943_9GAMM|nr:lipase secretion chaperone [Grimontia celer]CZF82826.1 Lipase chaperone [Grimontia celer]
MRITFTAYKIAIVVIAGVLFLAALYFYPGNGGNTAKLQAPSHEGTEVDISSDRDTFEYFLSTLGERDLAQITEDYEAFADTLSFGEKQKAQFEKYQAYRQSLARIPMPNGVSGLNYLTSIHEQMLKLQSEHFADAERKRIFYEENLAREMTIKRMRLEALGLEQDAMNAQWQAELDQLTPDMKESYQNAALLGEMNTLSTLEAGEKYQQLNELVGEEAMLRLQALEQEEAKFDTQFQQYLTERQHLLDESYLSDTEREQALGALRESYFTDEERRRAEALERIHDDEAITNANAI